MKHLTRLILLIGLVTMAQPLSAALSPVTTLAIPADSEARLLAVHPFTSDLLVYDCDLDVVRFVAPTFDPGSGTFSFQVADEVPVDAQLFDKCLGVMDSNTGIFYAYTASVHVIENRSVVNVFPVSARADNKFNGLAIRPARVDGVSNARLVIHETRNGFIDIVDLDAAGTGPLNIDRFDYRVPDPDSIRLTDVNNAVLDYNGNQDQLFIGDPNDPDNLGFDVVRFTLQRGIPANPVREPDIDVSFTGTGIKGLFIDPAADRAYISTRSQGFGTGNYVEIDTVDLTSRTIDLPGADRGHIGIDPANANRLFIPTGDLQGSGSPPVVLREFVDETEVDSEVVGTVGNLLLEASPVVVDPRLKLVYVVMPDQIVVYSTGTPEGPFPNPDRESRDVAPPGRIDAGDRFGAAVAVEGQRIAVGAPEDADGGNTGSVTIYRQDGTQLVQEAVLTVPPGFSAAGFGAALDLSGDRLVVGTRSAGAAAAKGLASLQAAIFERAQAGWDFKARIAPDDGTEDDGFGTAVAIEGSAVIVGAPGDDGGEGGSGAVYSFEFDGENLTQLDKAKPSIVNPGGGFGSALDLSNGMLVVGAPNSGIGAALTGLASLYGLVAGNLNELDMSSGLTANDGFGAAVAIQGDLLLVGAPGVDGAAGADQGGATVFRFSGGNLVRLASLAPADPVADGRFGAAVSASPRLLGVGSPGALAGSGTGAGYLFASTGNFALLEKLTSDSGQESLGTSIAVDQRNAVLGGPSTSSDAGAASFFVDTEVVYRSGFE